MRVLHSGFVFVAVSAVSCGTEPSGSSSDAGTTASGTGSSVGEESTSAATSGPTQNTDGTGSTAGTSAETGDPSGTGTESDDTGGPGDDCAPLQDPPDCTWNALEGPVPAGTDRLVGDGSDETAAAQAILDSMSPGDTVCFSPAPLEYSITGMTVSVADTTLYSDGWSGGEPGREARTDGTHMGARFVQRGDTSELLTIAAHGVTIDGLYLQGPGYIGPVNWSVVDGSGAERVTIRNCLITDGRNRGITLTYNSHEYLVRNNRIERQQHAGVYIHESQRGHILSNHIYDLNNPDQGGAPEGNAYGIVLAGTSGEAMADTVVMDNYVGHVAVWHGINQHAGKRALFADNVVEDVYETAAFPNLNACLVKTFWQNDRSTLHDHNLFINNDARDCTGYGAWNAGPRSVGNHEWEYEDNNNFIGNRFENVGLSYARGQRFSRHHHNNWSSDGSTLWTFMDGHPDLHVSNNLPDGPFNFGDEPLNLISDFAVPTSVPAALSVSAAVGGQKLRWEYPEGTDHDSFEVQFSVDADAWQELAFRPPADGRFSFSSSNPEQVPFEPRSYTHRTGDLGWYRVRAWNGDSPSDWSDAVQAQMTCR